MLMMTDHQRIRILHRDSFPPKKHTNSQNSLYLTNPNSPLKRHPSTAANGNSNSDPHTKQPALSFLLTPSLTQNSHLWGRQTGTLGAAKLGPLEGKCVSLKSTETCGLGGDGGVATERWGVREDA
ncbi:hypothetical protein M758_N006400 [Ceratodon purpureus]|nr:hypothetical protein M758_N006400 [Ceratodon purpureus]